MTRTEIANQIKRQETFKLGDTWIHITKVTEGAMTFVEFIANRQAPRTLWIGDLIDLIQELEIPEHDKCRKCKGTGATAHKHVQGGRCFRCGGDGRESTYKARKQAEKEREAYNASPEGKAAYAAYLSEMRSGARLY